MKLRNKKTGEIIDFEELNGYCLYDCGDKILLGKNPEEPVYGYTTLKEFNEDWEDYKPDEALIKDERIRKAVRAWAEVNGYTKLWVYHDYTTISFYNEDDGDNEITFNTMEKFGLEHLKCYAITELCGEEEE